MTSPLRMRCRTIRAEDVPILVSLLSRGFPTRTEQWWSRALTRLQAHAARSIPPTFGYLLEANGGAVGVLLAIYSLPRGDDPPIRRCNLSSWYVEPAYQVYASLLVTMATKQDGVTYTDLSPATHTLPMIMAQGFTKLTSGRVLAWPALGWPGRGVRVRRFDPDGEDRHTLGAGERDLLIRHTAYGCIALCVDTAEGTLPFLFLRRRLRWVVPSATLIYCRDVAMMVRHAGPIGRALLRHGIGVVSVDADGRIPGLPGWYRPDRTGKYVKGPNPPRLGDLTDTEFAMFGL